MKPYKNRENILLNFRWLGIVAQFGPGDWRLSAAPGSLRHPSREDAVRAAIEEADATSTPTTGATNAKP